jgi:prepilin-type N-terminal cleavage/methylation domain-containing protein
MKRRGLSLLEVLLALAILGGCLATIGTLIRLGSRGAIEARELTSAQILCEGKLAEFTSGIQFPEPGGPYYFEMAEDAGWVYYVDMAPLPQPGLLSLTVTVAQDNQLEPLKKPLSVSLTRWMQDPNLVLEEPEMPVEEEASTGVAPTINNNNNAGGGGGAGGQGGQGGQRGGRGGQNGQGGGQGPFAGGGPGGRGGQSGRGGGQPGQGGRGGGQFGGGGGQGPFGGQGGGGRGGQFGGGGGGQAPFGGGGGGRGGGGFGGGGQGGFGGGGGGQGPFGGGGGGGARGGGGGGATRGGGGNF